VDNYHKVKDQIKLGMSYSQVVEILEPTNAHESHRNKRVPDQYIKDGVLVQIYYARSRWVSDGNLTDDELTPYLFNDGELISIGWMNLGGTKTQGQVPDNNSTTIINNPAPIRVY
jgi:hypothetical protein